MYKKTISAIGFVKKRPKEAIEFQQAQLLSLVITSKRTGPVYVSLRTVSRFYGEIQRQHAKSLNGLLQALVAFI